MFVSWKVFINVKGAREFGKANHVWKPGGLTCEEALKITYRFHEYNQRI